MDQTECVSADWHALGTKDGRKGAKATLYSEYRKVCSAFGVAVDSDAYVEGWETGIREYCTHDNGYRIGTSGRIYQNSCPSALSDTFFISYQAGRSIFLGQLRVDMLRDEIQRTGDDLSKSALSEEKRESLSAKRKRAKRNLELANITLALSKSKARKLGFALSY